MRARFDYIFCFFVVYSTLYPRDNKWLSWWVYHDYIDRYKEATPQTQMIISGPCCNVLKQNATVSELCCWIEMRTKSGLRKSFLNPKSNFQLSEFTCPARETACKTTFMKFINVPFIEPDNHRIVSCTYLWSICSSDSLKVKFITRFGTKWRNFSSSPMTLVNIFESIKN